MPVGQWNTIGSSFTQRTSVAPFLLAHVSGCIPIGDGNDKGILTGCTLDLHFADIRHSSPVMSLGHVAGGLQPVKHFASDCACGFRRMRNSIRGLDAGSLAGLRTALRRRSCINRRTAPASPDNPTESRAAVCLWQCSRSPAPPAGSVFAWAIIHTSTDGSDRAPDESLLSKNQDGQDRSLRSEGSST